MRSNISCISGWLSSTVLRTLVSLSIGGKMMTLMCSRGQAKSNAVTLPLSIEDRISLWILRRAVSVEGNFL